MNKLYCFFLLLFTETHISLQSSVVIVRGISTNTTEDALLNYFENTRRSDGGQVEEVKITENTARVKFESSEGIFSFTYVTKPEKKRWRTKRPSDNEVSQFLVFFPCSSTK